MHPTELHCILLRNDAPYCAVMQHKLRCTLEATQRPAELR